jgi:hypothetical protein
MMSDLNFMRWVMELVNQEYSGHFVRLAQSADRQNLIVFTKDVTP